MILSLCSLVFGSFYLSYGVVKKSMEAQNSVQQRNDEGFAKNLNVATKKDETTAIIQSQNEDLSISKPQQIPSPPPPINSDKCAFRSYPKSRLYGLHDKSQPNFLSSDATYIRGELPIILNPIEKDDVEQTTPVKPCLDTTSWETLWDESTKRNRLPFTDGHNPSIVSLASNPYVQGMSNSNDNTNDKQQHIRLDPKHIAPLTSAFPNYSPNNLFLGVTIFGNGQCKFGLSEEEVTTYNFSTYNDPPDGKRTIIAVMTPPMPLETEQQKQQPPFQILGQTTLLLERDVKYGTKRQRGKYIEAESNPQGGGYTRIHQEFDDPRFFFHEGRLWVLYRNGPLFGYQDQIHNPVHFESVGGDGGEVKFVAYVKASETVRVCCGRNIALISEEVARVVNDGSSGNSNGGDGGEKKEVEWMPSGGLKALTWVDPVTVVDVALGDVSNLLKDHRQLSESEVDEEARGDGLMIQADLGGETSMHHRRRLGSAKKPKSNIHGTNGYLVPLPSSGELLGIAHFHRPENRKESNYALHGHHYTHSFFTIARQHQPTDSGGDNTFQLKRISNEFLFRALSVPMGEKKSPNDGDIIQFASGLDVYGSDIDGKLVLSYGINDCEGAVLTISMAKLQQMLIEVEPGQEVVDLMRTAK